MYTKNVFLTAGSKADNERIQERDRCSIDHTFNLELSLEPSFDCVANKALGDVFVRFK